MTKSGKTRVLYFIQLPPPIHGVSKINQFIFGSDVINQGFEKSLLKINFSRNIQDLRKFSLKKILTAIRLFFQLIINVQKFKPDLVYFSLMPVGIGFLRDLTYVWILKIFKRKVIYHLHNRGIARYAKKRYWNKLYCYVFNHANVIHVSDGLMKTEIEILNLTHSNLFIQPNTTDSFSIIKKKRSVNSFNIMFFSNLFDEKGLMILLNAFLAVKQAIPNVLLQVYGASRGGKQDAEYNKFVLQNNLQNKVYFKGFLNGENKAEALQMTDIFVFPSYFSEECFPLVLLEAMQAELPIVATKIGAIPEMIQDGKEGILIDLNDHVQLAKKIIILARNERLRKELGKNAYIKFIENYTLVHFEHNMRSIFTKVLST